MNAKKILFPTDFSDAGQAALEYASALASEARAALYIAHVDELPDAFVPGFGAGPDGYGYVPDPNNIRKEVRERLSQVTPAVRGVACEHRYLRGNPADEILQFADSEGIDLIVMGTHGRTGVSRLLMGSVAEAVVRRARCPVLTVKQPAPHPEEAQIS